MTFGPRCEERHPGLGYQCERDLDHPGEHDAFGLEWLRPTAVPGPILHLATPGYPGGADIQHPSGECVWCDAERWRKFVRACPELRPLDSWLIERP